jgi:hypothetical protein
MKRIASSSRDDEKAIRLLDERAGGLPAQAHHGMRMLDRDGCGI